VVTIMWIFNLRAAVMATLLVSCAVGIFRIYSVRINHWSSIFFGYATFFIFFCFWQRIRSLFCTRRIVFLDKLCIAQHDEELKQRGIG
ncbi:unnamed protein product, partial [Symbiodinium pilosum]